MLKAMQAQHRRGLAGVVLAVVPLLFAAGWMAVLLQLDPLKSRFGALLPWPVACSLRGCVTTTAWEAHSAARVAFNQAVHQPAPTAAEALTTLIRQHLVSHAFVRVPVTAQDAVRYREEVLNARDEATVRETVGLSLADYDKYVILPLLQQEALRQETKVETFDELFTLLARERPMWALSRGLVWDRSTAKVIER